MNENVIEFMRNSNTATVTFSQARYVTRIKELAIKYPKLYQITHVNSDGSIIAHIPVTDIHINHRSTNLSDDQRELLAQRATDVFAAIK